MGTMIQETLLAWESATDMALRSYPSKKTLESRASPVFAVLGFCQSLVHSVFAVCLIT